MYFFRPERVHVWNCFENEWVSVAYIMCNSFPDSLLVSGSFMYYSWLDMAGVFENRKYSEEGLISKATGPPFTAIFLLASLLGGGGGFFPRWSDMFVYVCWGILFLWKCWCSEIWAAKAQ